ncbi:MAG: hypothetical protein Q9174_002976 [Haloplaca sp. 1 TL-2023]
MQRRISVGLPTHLRLEGEGKGYGVPATRKSGFVPSTDPGPKKWVTLSELLSSMLVALSFTCVSVLYSYIEVPPSNGDRLPVGRTLELFGNRPYPGTLKGFAMPSALFLTFAVTAVTLIAVGLIGKLSTVPTASPSKASSVSSGASKDAASWSGKKLMSTGRKTTETLSSLALPLYAALALGGSRVALILLMATFAKIMTLENKATALNDLKGWKQLFYYRRWTIMSILMQAVLDFGNPILPSNYSALATGYLALMVSILIIPPPFPSINRDASIRKDFSKPSSASVVLSSGFETSSATNVSSLKQSTITPLLCTPDAVSITLQAGLCSAVFSFLAFASSTLVLGAISSGIIAWTVLTIIVTSLCLLQVQLQSLQENIGIGVLIGGFFSSLASQLLLDKDWRLLACQSVVVCLSVIATHADTRSAHGTSAGLSQNHSGSHHHTTSHVHNEEHSRFTKYLLATFQHRPLLHSILVEKDSRRIFYFMCLNFAFMLVQLFYGIATGSLGLLSDSIHMFFDCLALLVGLCAAVMSKWPPSTRFPYGYGKVDTLAGFANGVFLMLISVEIVYEAIERLAEGSEMQRIGELLTVSTLGLMTTPHHHHSHGNENMYGIYLHIIADTLGSVAVVASTLLIHFYGWSGFDPLASCFIAILIFASAIPLVKSSAKNLLLTIPEDTEFDLREALAGVAALRGVVGYAAPKFWLEEGSDGKVLGVIHVTAARGADMEDVKERAVAYLRSKNMDILVQVERDGTNRCWCKAKAG